MNDKQFILLLKVIARTGALIAFALLGVMASVLLHPISSSTIVINILLVALPILCWSFFQTLQVKLIEKLISNYVDIKMNGES